MHTKQETKFTPGPYSISGIPGDNHVMAFVPRLGRKVSVAIVPGFPGISPEEHQANLALFRSAPELLTALVGVMLAEFGTVQIMRKWCAAHKERTFWHTALEALEQSGWHGAQNLSATT